MNIRADYFNVYMITYYHEIHLNEIFISVLNLDMEKLYEYSSIIFSENIHLRN